MAAIGLGVGCNDGVATNSSPTFIGVGHQRMAPIIRGHFKR